MSFDFDPKLDISGFRLSVLNCLLQSARAVAALYSQQLDLPKSKIIDESLEWLNLDENEFVQGLSTKYEWKDSDKGDTTEMTDKLKSFVSKGWVDLFHVKRISEFYKKVY